ncbi:MAG: hypothetical protein OEZ58_02135 [Gammaproteobacteria bacterium]|nr:hypothetical protein [Gammaproteobacteria bacterium]MDH5727762.1 hypothetical protein [Gammaproteobacteria bacterium]
MRSLQDLKYSISAFIVAICYWLLDSSIHYVVFTEPAIELIPHDANELWMRIMLFLLLVSFGFYVDHNNKLLRKKELEKQKIFLATVHSSHHIVNNLLNQMQYFQQEAMQSHTFNQEMIELYEQSMREGESLLKRLSEVNDIDETTIINSVTPKPNKT